MVLRVTRGKNSLAVKFVSLVFLAMLFAVQVSADQSELVLSVNQDNKLFVERLFDDDGSIELLDVCVLTLSSSNFGGTIPTQSDCHRFEGVVDGQVLDIDLAEHFDTPQVSLLPYDKMEDLKNGIFLTTNNNVLPCLDSRTGEPAPCPPTNSCGNGVCGNGENCLNCSVDCPVCSSQKAAAYYNFIDTDGTVTNAKFSVFASTPTFAPALTSTEVESSQENVVVSKSLTPRRSTDLKGFEVEARVKFKPGFDPETVNFWWLVSDSGSASEKEMVKDGEEWVATIGSFSDPMQFTSYMVADLGTNQGFHIERFGKMFLYMILPNKSGVCQTATFLPSNNFRPLVFKSNQNNTVFLQTGVDQPGWTKTVSRLKILPQANASPQDSFVFRVGKVSDETSCSLASGTDCDAADEIEVLNVFVISNDGVTSQEFTNVTEGTVITVNKPVAQTGSPVLPRSTAISASDGSNIVIDDPSGAEVFYNFMDSDDLVGNLNLLLPLNPRDIIDSPSLVPLDRGSFIQNVEMQVVPNADCSSFSLKFKAKVDPAATVERVFMRYGFGNYDLRQQSPDYNPPVAGLNSDEERELVLRLQEDNGEFEGELGPFSSSDFEFFSRVYTELSNGATNSWQNFFSWFAMGDSDEPPPAQETCGDNIDNDGDGSTDEGCVVLPDLLFVDDQNIPEFVSVGDALNASMTVKNAGVINTGEFSVSFLLNNELIGSFQFDDGLVAEQEQVISFHVPDTTPFIGLNELKIIIDPENSVPELNKANNEIIKQLAVGYNSFNIALNFNNTELLGDLREFRAFDRENGKPQQGVQAIITFPSGNTQEITTNERGISEFLLKEHGIYFLTAAKDKFETFEATFTVPQIILANLKPRYEIGEQVLFFVETGDGGTVSDAVVEIKDPNNQVLFVPLDSEAKAEFLTKLGGTHEIKVSRKGVEIFKGTFLATGFVESVFVSGGIQELIFGSIARQFPLFAVLLLFSAGAAAIAFSRSKLLFKAKVKSTREEQLENIARLFIAIVFFMVPFQVSNYLGFNGGLAALIIEVLVVFLFENYRKKKGKERKAIKI